MEITLQDTLRKKYHLYFKLWESHYRCQRKQCDQKFHLCFFYRPSTRFAKYFGNVKNTLTQVTRSDAIVLFSIKREIPSLVKRNHLFIPQQIATEILAEQSKKGHL